MTVLRSFLGGSQDTAVANMDETDIVEQVRERVSRLYEKGI